MTKAIRFHAPGGPEVFQWDDVEVGAPGAGEVRLRQTAVGLNYIDTYHRSGLYPVPLPGVIGLEAAGVVDSVGAGVPVVHDSVGKDTFDSSLDSLRRFGMMVTFGNASGPVDPFPPGQLGAKGSLFITRPTLMDYTAARADLLASAHELFDVVGSGAVKISVNQTYPLSEAAQAHRDLEARRTTGSTVLLP